MLDAHSSSCQTLWSLHVDTLNKLKGKIMKRNDEVLILLAAVLCFAPTVHAEDLSGRWGIGGVGGAAIPVAEHYATHAGKVGAAAGAFARYGFNSHWGATLSYDNLSLQNNIRVEPVNLSGIYSFTPEKRWTPVAQLGAGVGKGDNNPDLNDVTAKAGVGADYFLSPDFSVGGQLVYHFISNTGDGVHTLHILSPVVNVMYYFGGATEPKSQPAPVTPKATIIAPPVTPIALNLVPAQTNVAPSQTVQLTPTVTGTSNTDVRWSLAPTMGSLSDQGLYTAPSSIPFPATVTATATSIADASKTASAIFQLTPPASAPKQVSIELHILFDSSKDVIKTEFDPELQRVADFMRQYSGTQAEIEGHTDSSGRLGSNMVLSQQRANAVRNYLASHFQIAGTRLSAKGYGPTKPVADNKTAEGRAKNRRVIATFTNRK
jgi:OOP family OmpA-OmpF porin